MCLKNNVSIKKQIEYVFLQKYLFFHLNEKEEDNMLKIILNAIKSALVSLARNVVGSLI